MKKCLGILFVTLALLAANSVYAVTCENIFGANQGESDAEVLYSPSAALDLVSPLYSLAVDPQTRQITILWQTPQAEPLVLLAFGRTDSVSDLSLPDTIQEWLKRYVRNPHKNSNVFRQKTDGREFVFKVFRPANTTRRNMWLLSIREYSVPYILSELQSAFRLSPRETEVLFWIAHGKTNEEIGSILGNSPMTVKKLFEHITLKIGVRNRTQAGIRAVQSVPSLLDVLN